MRSTPTPANVRSSRNNIFNRDFSLGGVILLKRQNYFELKSQQMKEIILDVLERLLQMADQYTAHLEKPSDKKKAYILQVEQFVNQSEERVNDHILELLSLQPVAKDKVKELFGISRIAGLLERVGDQLINLLTISDGENAAELMPMIEQFFHYEREMMGWLIQGIEKNDRHLLELVISHDQYVNRLNKGTYQSVVHSVQEQEKITESNLKTIIMSRFLERLGDYLVTIAKIYHDFLDTRQASDE